MSESPIRDAYLKSLLNPEQEGDSPPHKYSPEYLVSKYNPAGGCSVKPYLGRELSVKDWREWDCECHCEEEEEEHECDCPDFLEISALVDLEDITEETHGMDLKRFLLAFAMDPWDLFDEKDKNKDPWVMLREYLVDGALDEIGRNGGQEEYISGQCPCQEFMEPCHIYGGEPMCGECKGPRDEKRCCIR